MSDAAVRKNVPRLESRRVIDLDTLGEGYDLAWAPSGDAFAVSAGTTVAVYQNDRRLWTREVGEERPAGLARRDE